MQARTTLGLAGIALLTAACVAPHGIDWTPDTGTGGLAGAGGSGGAGGDGVVGLGGAGGGEVSDAGFLDAAASGQCSGVDLAQAPTAKGLSGAVFVAGGYEQRLIRSADGVHWDHDVSLPAPDPTAGGGASNPAIMGLAVGGGALVAAAAGGVLRTTDLDTWTPVSCAKGGSKTQCSNEAFMATTYALGQFAVLELWPGQMFSFAPTAASYPATATLGGGPKMYALASGGGHVIAVGDNLRSFVSEDLVTWHDDQSTPSAPALRAIAYGGGRFVAVGEDGLSGTTPDGKKWSVDKTDPERGNFGGIVYFQGQFVACSDVDCYASPDGTTWKAAGADQHPSGALAEAGGLLVGLAWPATILVSSDGATWTPVFCGAPPALTSLAVFPKP